MPRVSSRRQAIRTLRRLANQDHSFISHSLVLPARRKVFSSRNSGLSAFCLILQLPQIQAVFNLEPHVCVALWMIFQRRPKRFLKSSTSRAEQHPLAPFDNPALWSLAIDMIERKRYFESRRREPQACLTMFNRLWASRDETFLTVARMNRSSFLTLLNKLATGDLFENQSSCLQAPIELQLVVTLANLGLSGNGGGLDVLAHLFGISKGSVENYTWRCVVAIVRMERQYLSWPTPSERVKIRKAVGRNSPFKSCVGFVDGTLIPLAFGPPKCKEDYWTQKYFYAVNSMLVCNHDRRITFARHGWCGSVHDQRVMRTSSLWSDPNRFFSAGEYLLVDSGYSCNTFIIPAFKRVGGIPLTREKMEFNKILSELRVAIEHCNGMLKSRWQSLKDLRLLLKDKKCVTRLNAWISACCILHNFLLDQNEQCAFRYNVATPVDPEDEFILNEILEDDNEDTRMHVFRVFCNAL